MTSVLLLAALGGALAGAPAPAHRRAHATVTPDRPQLILGVEQEMPLTIEVHDNDAAIGFAPERAIASIGTIAAIVPAGPDRFTARYLAPSGRFPQVTMIVVDLVGAGQHLRATTRLALHAAAEMPFRTSANAQVTVRVQDKTFGPVRADAEGDVAIPIVVPPGVRDGLARATDAFGSARETLVDLQPAPFNQLLIVAAPQFEVGNFAEVSIFAVTSRGDPMARGRATLASPEALVHPLGGGIPGEERFLVEAPRRLGDGAVRLVATAVDLAPEPLMVLEKRTDLVVPLIAGRPHRLTLTASTDRLIIGGGGAVTVLVAARDRHDNPASCASARITVAHQPVPIVFDDSGCGKIVIPAPAPGQRRPAPNLAIEAALGGLRARTSIRVTTGPAVRLTAAVSTPQVVGDGRRSIDVRVDAVDKIGQPTIVTNLRWQAAGGRLGPIQTPEEGTYLTQFTPNRAQATRTEVLVVKGDPSLSATTVVLVEPPRARFALTARVGLYSNFGSMAGPLASIEGMRELSGGASAWAAGVVVSYLHNDLTTTAGGAAGLPDTRIQIDQVPVLAVARYRIPLPLGSNVAVGGGVGLSLARATISSRHGNWPTSHGNASAAAAEGRADVAFPLVPGELVVGARYLWVDLGRTSQGDQIAGNSVGLVGDIGFRMTW